MNDAEQTEIQVITWYNDNWNGRVLPFFRKPLLTPETSLSTGKYPWSKEDAAKIMDDYFFTFHVDKNGFFFDKYWPNEEVFMPLNRLRTRDDKWQWIEPKPLTLKMLVESAKAGRWLDN